MSWAAHQFEVYAVAAHLPKKMKGKVSWWAIFLGDTTPDFLAKFWVYGFTYNGVHYGASKPYEFHRGWPGMGVSHTLFLGALVTTAIWAWKGNRAWTIGYLLGFAAHVLTDVNDSIGTMLLFPFTTLNWSLHTWAYAAAGGKYNDAAAYYSSLGFAMDVFWLLVVLGSWRVLTKEFWRTQIVPAALPQHLLLRRMPLDRVDDLGARRGVAGDQRREAIELPVGSLLERAGLGAARDPAARFPARGAPGDARTVGRRLLRGERPLGAARARHEECERVAESATVDRRRVERLRVIDGGDDVRAEHRGRVEVEAAQEVRRAHVDRERMRLGYQTHRDQAFVDLVLEEVAGRRGAPHDDVELAHAVRAHVNQATQAGRAVRAPRRAWPARSRRDGGAGGRGRGTCSTRRGRVRAPAR
jgi:hypothetical protein